MLRNLVAAKVARVIGCPGKAGLAEAMNICAAPITAACSGIMVNQAMEKHQFEAFATRSAVLVGGPGDRLNKRAILNEALDITKSKGGMLLQR